MTEMGSIEAYLKLDITDFEKKVNEAAKDFDKQFGKGLSSQLSSPVPAMAAQQAEAFAKQLSQAAVNSSYLQHQLGNLGITTSQFSRILNDARSSGAALGNTIQSLSRNIPAATSSILPGDALSKQFNLGTQSLLTMADQARATNREYSQLTSNAKAAGRAAVSAYPIEHIERTAVAQAAFNQQILTSASSYAGTGRSFLAAETAMTGGWGRVESAASKVSNTVGTIGTKLNNASNALNNFGTGLLGIVGIMGSQQIYDFTVGMANTFQGYEQFWAKAYGQNTADLYAQTVEKMQSQYYSQPATTAKTLQLLANTMPTTTSAQDISSLTPYVQAYINFYKKMKPEFASLAEIEGPQDVAAVFSGNTGEIRASPLAQPLKEIAAMPDAQKMTALKQLFESRGIMEFTSGLTQYDKEMNKFNSTLNELGINVGSKLLPSFTRIMQLINTFVQGNEAAAEFAITAGGVVAVLAAIGGVGGLALQGLQSGWTIIAGMGKEAGTLTARLLSAAGAQVVLNDSTKAMTATNVSWGSTLRNVGSSLVSFLISPVGIAVVAVGALAAIILVLGNEYGWFKSAVARANDEMNRLNTQTTTAANKQTEAQQKVNELTKKLNEQAEGTPGWIQTKLELANAEMDLKKATGEAANASTYASIYQQQLADAQNSLKESYIGLYRATIAYNLARGLIKPEDAQAQLTGLDQVTQGNYSNITSIYAQKKAIDDTTGSVDGATNSWNLFGDAIGRIAGPLTTVLPLWDRINQYMAPFVSGQADWSKFNPLQSVTGNPPGTTSPDAPNSTGPLSTLNRIGQLFGLGDLFNPTNNTTNSTNATPTSWVPKNSTWGVSHAADGEGKPGILEDILGSKGVLRGTGLESGGGINNLFKNFKLPTAAQVLNLLKPKIPTLSWKLPNPTQILTQTWQKINPLNWKIPNPSDFLMQTWYKISNLLWQIPGAGDFLGQTWQKIWELIWNPPTIDDIKGIIWQKIKDFVWPMGPAPAGGGSGGGGGGTFGPPPRGPINDTIVSAMSARSGVGSGFIANALANRFQGLAGFSPIAEGMAAPLSYEFYYGGQKTNQQVWDTGTCNCYDGAEFLQAEASQRFGLDTGLQNGLWDGTSIAHTWSIINGRPFDMAAKLLRGQWNNPSGPYGDFANFMTDIGPGLEYIGYAGHAQSGMSALDGGGNCFDMSLGIMDIANNLFGLPVEMIWGTYDGQSHVWPRIGNTDYDPTRRALVGNYSPPPRGPLRSEEPREVHFHITNKFEKEVYGVEDLDTRVKEQSKAGALEIMNKYFKPNAFG